MKKILFVFLLSIFATNVFAGYGGYIGKYDNRRYASPSEPEYSGLVRLTKGAKVIGSGVFVSENLILTNNHCVEACQNDCVAKFWNGSGYETSNVKVVSVNPNDSASSGYDWGLLVSDKTSKFYKPIAPVSTPGQVLRGGYGQLRVIEDDEIPLLKEVYSRTKQEYKKECEEQKGMPYEECINKKVDEKLEQMGKKPLFHDAGILKVQTCKIIGNYAKNPKMLETDCDSSGGDSGAPLLRNGEIVGLNNSGFQMVFGKTETGARAVKTETFYLYVQEMIKKYQEINALEKGFAK